MNVLKVAQEILKKENWKIPFAVLPDNTKIYIVDGNHIRNNIFVDFVLGGHGYVYDFVPKDEIWIERIQNSKDEQYNFTHEVIEYLLMKHCKKYYDDAHDFSAKIEDILRKYNNQKTVSNASKFFYVPQIRQNTDYTCGAASVASIMAYYGYDVVESDAAKDLKTTKKDGTHPQNIVDYFNKNGLEAQKKTLTPETLRDFLKKDIPVIIELQAWGDKNDYSKDFENGHYVVAIGYDENGFYFMDPSQFGYGYLDVDELQSRWHDENKGKIDQNLGIPVSGKKPQFTINDVKKIQ